MKNPVASSVGTQAAIPGCDKYKGAEDAGYSAILHHRYGIRSSGISHRESKLVTAPQGERFQ